MTSPSITPTISSLDARVTALELKAWLKPLPPLAVVPHEPGAEFRIASSHGEVLLQGETTILTALHGPERLLDGVTWSDGDGGWALASIVQHEARLHVRAVRGGMVGFTAQYTDAYGNRHCAARAIFIRALPDSPPPELA